MRRVGVGGLVIALLIVSALGDGAQAAKKRAKAAEPEPPSLPPAVHNWSGFYTGVNAGIAWGSFTPVTSTIPGGVTGVIGAATTPLFNAAGHQAGSPFGFGNPFGFGFPPVVQAARMARQPMNYFAPLNYQPSLMNSSPGFSWYNPYDSSPGFAPMNTSGFGSGFPTLGGY